MSKAVRLINDYLEAIRKTQEAGEKLGILICETVRDIIPDIEFSLGWAEAGVDTLCFFSKSKKKWWGVPFDAVLREVFPELFIDAPYGVYLSSDEAEEARKRLKALRGELEGKDGRDS